MLLETRLRVLLLAMLATYTSSAPINGPAVSSSKPRWKNPCSLPRHLFSGAEDMKNGEEIATAELFQDIKTAATKAYNNGKVTLKEFVNAVFGEPEFEVGTANQREDWLPKIPEATESHLRTLQKDKALKSAYRDLQIFAVGLEQAILDQLDQKQLNMFRDAENDLIAVLCELQRAMAIEKVTPDADVKREVMKIERKSLSTLSHRNVRDYLILRDYVKAVNYIVKVFDHFKSNL